MYLYISVTACLISPDLHTHEVNTPNTTFSGKDLDSQAIQVHTGVSCESMFVQFQSSQSFVVHNIVFQLHHAIQIQPEYCLSKSLYLDIGVS